MHFDLGRWKIVVEVGGLEGQWLPACHILFIYNFQCATLTSVTFQLVGGGTEQKKKKQLGAPAKKDILYIWRSFCFCCRRSFAAQNLLWMFKNKQRQRLQREGNALPSSARLLCRQVAPNVPMPDPFPFSLHFPFEFAPRRVVKFHLPLPRRLLSLFLSQIETEIKFASCWIFVLVLPFFSIRSLLAPPCHSFCLAQNETHSPKEAFSQQFYAFLFADSSALVVGSSLFLPFLLLVEVFVESILERFASQNEMLHSGKLHFKWLPRKTASRHWKKKHTSFWGINFMLSA